MTPAEVRAYQLTKPRDWNGALLGVDGDLGNRTKWSLAIDDLPRYRRRIVRAATLWRGVVESPLGSNRGELIDEWVRDAGGKLGDSWCAAYVRAVLLAAGVPCIRTVSAKACLEQFELIHAEEAIPGDLAGWVEADGHGHVFPMIGWTKEGVAGMEGNHDSRVSLTSRMTQSLQFRRVPAPDSFTATVFEAPLVMRSLSNTR